MIELHWTGDRGEYCVTRPPVDGVTAQIIVPTSLKSGNPLTLTNVDGVSSDAAAALMSAYGHKL